MFLLNKQEKNIVDILTFDEVEDIVDIFIRMVYHIDETVALITNRELVEYAMGELISDNCIAIKKVDLELDDENIEYMISVDCDGNTVVQPVEYYDDKYFMGIDYAFIDMDGCVEQTTIDNLLDRNVPVVLFGLDDYDDEFDCANCDLDECMCCGELESKDGDSENDNKNVYTVNVKCNLDADEAEKIIADMEKRVERMHDMFIEMDAFRRIFRW